MGFSDSRKLGMGLKSYSESETVEARFKFCYKFISVWKLYIWKLIVNQKSNGLSSNSDINFFVCF